MSFPRLVVYTPMQTTTSNTATTPTIRIALVVSSTRTGRFADKATQWVLFRLQKHSFLHLDIVDLRHHQLPPFDERSPAWAPREYATPAIKAFAERIDEADAYLFLVAEYNHGYTGVLKNAMDHLYVEFARKPAAFVAWGNVGGARAVEQLRNVAVQFGMAPLRQAVHIMPPLAIEVSQMEPFDTSALDSLMPGLELLVDDLIWWSTALKAARSHPTDT
jgi:NAD(P)H-dependent FMN reductase